MSDIHNTVETYLCEIIPAPKTVVELECGSSQLCVVGQWKWVKGVESSLYLLDVVRRLGIYSELVHQMRLEYLSSGETADVVIDLVNLLVRDSILIFLNAVNEILHSSGHFICLTEQVEFGYCRQISGNMSYSSEYFRTQCREYGFEVRQHTRIRIRRDGVRWIFGDLWMLIKD